MEEAQKPDIPPEVQICASDVQSYKLQISGATRASSRASCKLVITLPKIRHDGVYELDGVRRAIICKAFKDLNDTSPNRKFVVCSKVQVLMKALDEILTRTLTNFYFGGQSPPLHAAQHLVDSWLRTSEYCQYIPDTAVADTSVPEMVSFKDAIKKGLDLQSRTFPSSLKGVIDPGSTSTSNRINLIYRMVQGTKIRQQALCPGEEKRRFCSAIENNAVGVQYTPKRIHMLRAQFEQALTLLHGEDPWVSPRNNQLSGVHLTTAIMNFGINTFEDAICFSEGAAMRMTCIRRYKVAVATAMPVTVCVKEGDLVSHLTKILEYEDAVSGKARQLSCTKLGGHIGTVESIRAYPTTQYNVQMYRYRVTIRCDKPLEPGDKVTTRGAIKGTAMIVPDRQMPIMHDGTRVECIISPESVYNRQSMVTFWEMMCNLKADYTSKIIQSRPFAEENTFEGLVEEGYGAPTQLTLRSEKLEHETYVAPLFMLRLDKIADEIVSFQDGKVHLNEQNLPVDSADPSGQRRDLALSMDMDTKGLSVNLEYMLKDASGTGVVRDIASVVRHGHDEESPQS